MDKNLRKELIAEYKKQKTYMGVIKITNKANGKIFVAAYPNLKNKCMNIEGQLVAGRFANLKLQKDWKELGHDNFTFDIIDEKETDEITDMKWELKKMEKSWVEKLQSYGEGGYNKAPSEYV